MRRPVGVLATLALALLMAPAAQAGTHADPRSCGTITFPATASDAEWVVHEAVAVGRGRVLCGSARRIARFNPVRHRTGPGAYRRDGWLCDDDYNGCVRGEERINTSFHYEAGTPEEESDGIPSATPAEEESGELIPGGCWPIENCERTAG
jgi:hypothetical protein